MPSFWFRWSWWRNDSGGGYFGSTGGSMVGPLRCGSVCGNFSRNPAMSPRSVPDAQGSEHSHWESHQSCPLESGDPSSPAGSGITDLCNQGGWFFLLLYFLRSCTVCFLLCGLPADANRGNQSGSVALRARSCWKSARERSASSDGFECSTATLRKP